MPCGKGQPGRKLLACIERAEAALSTAMSKESDSFVPELELKIMPDQVNVSPFSNIGLNPEFEAFITGVVQKIEACPVTSQILIRVPFHINQEMKNDAR
jgi:hypothetical protein